MSHLYNTCEIISCCPHLHLQLTVTAWNRTLLHCYSREKWKKLRVSWFLLFWETLAARLESQSKTMFERREHQTVSAFRIVVHLTHGTSFYSEKKRTSSSLLLRCSHEDKFYLQCIYESTRENKEEKSKSQRHQHDDLSDWKVIFFFRLVPFFTSYLLWALCSDSGVLRRSLHRRGIRLLHPMWIYFEPLLTDYCGIYYFVFLESISIKPCSSEK